MSALRRSAGQSPMLPGAVRAGGLVHTSGVVAPDALEAMAGGGPTPSFVDQCDAAMDALLAALAGVGATPADVVKVEAFLADAGDFATWNATFVRVWPQPGPARTTLVSAFVSPAVLIELQAVAVVE